MTKVKDLKKLPPEERIRKLKELAENDKKEIEEAQKLIRDSEIEEEEKKKLLRKIPIPQMKAVDIESLFSETEKQAFETVRQVQRKKEEPKMKDMASEEEKKSMDSLEETVKVEQPRFSEEEFQENKQYLHALGTEKLHNKREEIYASIDQRGYSDSRQQMEIYNIHKEEEERLKDANEGNYNTSRKLKELLEMDLDRSRKQYGN